MGDDTFYQQQQEGYPIQYKMEMLSAFVLTSGPTTSPNPSQLWAWSSQANKSKHYGTMVGTSEPL